MKTYSFVSLVFYLFFITQTFAQDYVGGILVDGKRKLSLHCLEKNKNDQSLCERAQFILVEGKNIEVVGESTITPDEIKYFLSEVSTMDEDDFTNNGLMKYLGQNYIGISLWCMMLGKQMESKAATGVAATSLVITTPLQLIKYPFVALTKWIQKKQAKHRIKKFNELLSAYTEMKILSERDLIKSKISKESFENILTWIDQSKLSPPPRRIKPQSGMLKHLDLSEQVENTTQNVAVEVLAKFKTNSKIYSSPAVAKDGTVIIGSHLGTVYIFNSQMKLQEKYKALHWIHGSPKILNNGLMTIPSYDGFLYFFNIDGKMVNKAAPGGTIFSSTAELNDGTVLMGSDDGKLYFMSKEDGQVIRSFQTQGMIHCTPKILPNGLIAVSSIDHNLYFINDKAELKYKYETLGGLAHSEPALLKDGSLVFGSYDKFVHFVDQKGKLKAKFETEGWVHSTPAILHAGTDHEVVVIGSNDGYIYFLNSDGTLKSKIKTGAKVISSPAILNDGTVVVGSYDHHVYFVNEEGIIAKFKTNGKIWSSPAVLPDGQSIVIGSGDHYLYYLKLKKYE